MRKSLPEMMLHQDFCGPLIGIIPGINRTETGQR